MVANVLAPSGVAREAISSSFALVVVLDAGALLLRGERDAEVEVEVAAERGRPGKRPPHALLVCLQFRQRRPRYRPKHDVVVRQMNGGAVKAVGDRRA